MHLLTQRNLTKLQAAALNLSTSSQMTAIVLAFAENIGALAQWKSAKIFKELSLDLVTELIEKSETRRAVATAVVTASRQATAAVTAGAIAVLTTSFY